MYFPIIKDNSNTTNLMQYCKLHEKDECKIIISDYLNERHEGKQIQAKNVNQLYFIIDFLIDYINNRFVVVLQVLLHRS